MIRFEVRSDCSHCLTAYAAGSLTFCYDALGWLCAVCHDNLHPTKSRTISSVRVLSDWWGANQPTDTDQTPDGPDQVRVYQLRQETVGDPDGLPTMIGPWIDR